MRKIVLDISGHGVGICADSSHNRDRKYFGMLAMMLGEPALSIDPAFRSVGAGVHRQQGPDRVADRFAYQNLRRSTCARKAFLSVHEGGGFWPDWTETLRGAGKNDFSKQLRGLLPADSGIFVSLLLPSALPLRRGGGGAIKALFLLQQKPAGWFRPYGDQTSERCLAFFGGVYTVAR